MQIRRTILPAMRSEKFKRSKSYVFIKTNYINIWWERGITIDFYRELCNNFIVNL